MKILIDNGHGSDTPGKHSPSGKFLEYRYNRIITVRVVSDLVDCGYDDLKISSNEIMSRQVQTIVPERIREYKENPSAL